MSLSDTNLHQQWCYHRNADAFTELVCRHSSMVFSTCLRVLQNESVAEEAAQDCFVELMETPKPITPSVGGWLHTVATRRAMDRLRSDISRAARENAYAANRPKTAAPAWDDLSPVIDAAISDLPEEYRLPVVLRFLEGKSHKEIARELDISHSTVRRRLQQGVAGVRKHLTGRGIAVGTGALVALLESAPASALPKAIAAELAKRSLAAGPVLGKSSAGPLACTASLGGILAMKKIAFAAVVLGLVGAFFAHNRRPSDLVPADVPQGIDGPSAALSSESDSALPPLAPDVAPKPVIATAHEAPKQMLDGDGAVRVFVTDRGGLSAAEVSVKLEPLELEDTPDGPLLDGETDGRGKLLLEGLPWGEYLVVAERGGMLARAAVSLSAEIPLALAQLSLNRGGRIAGTVINTQGTPVPQARVALVEVLRVRERPAVALTDNTGAFVIPGIPLGLYRLRAIAAGYAPALSGEVTIDAAPVHITLNRGATLRGTVRFAGSNRLAPGVALRIGMPEFEGMPRSAVSDGRGGFSAEALPLGVCHVTSADDRYAFNPVRTEVSLTAERIAQVEILIEDGAQVSGTITDGATGEPLAGACVYASDSPSRVASWKAKPTGIDGRYTICGLPAGECEVQLHPFPPRYNALWEDVRETLQLRPGEVRGGVDFQLRRGALVEGTVVDEEGAPVYRARINLTLIRAGDRGPAHMPPAFSDTAGRFYFPDVGLSGAAINEDGTLVRAIGGSVVTLQATFRGSLSPVAGPFPLPADGLRDITLRLAMVPSGAISGIVSDEAGNPALAYIGCSQGDGSGLLETGSTTSDVDGYFLLNNLAPGDYELRIAPYEDSGMIPRMTFARGVSLEAGERVTDLRLVLREGVRITGRVADAQGRPAKSYMLEATSAIGEDNGASAITDGDGRFSFLNLDEGEYDLTPMDNAFGWWRQRVTTGEDVEIVLPAAEE